MTGEGKVVESLLLHSEYWGGLLQNAMVWYFGASKKREAVANIVTRGRRRESASSLANILLFFMQKVADNHCTGVAIEEV